MNARINAAIALLAVAGLAQAAGPVEVALEQPPEAPQTQVLQELEEVTVHGKRLRDRLVEAEDEFYKLYNQINKDDDFDTNCAYVRDPENPGSQIQHRLCLPVFVANSVADYAQWKVRCQPPLEGFDEFSCLDRNDDERLTWQEASARPELEAQLFTLDADHSGYLTRDELPEEGMSGPPLYQPPPPELVLAEGAERWRDHMMSVIRSDPRLGEMAGRLDDLVRELGETQRRSRELQEALPEDPVRRVRSRPPR